VHVLNVVVHGSRVRPPLGRGGGGDTVAVRVVGHRVPGAARDRRRHVAVAVASRHAAGVV